MKRTKMDRPLIVNIQGLQNSHMKFEWNCGKDANMTLEDKIIQFRASGIRVKLPTFSPALNLVGTQIPIFPWIHVPDSDLLGRYMTVKEKLRRFKKWRRFNLRMRIFV